jgi:hypothetical protein
VSNARDARRVGDDDSRVSRRLRGRTDAAPGEYIRSGDDDSRVSRRLRGRTDAAPGEYIRSGDDDSRVARRLRGRTDAAPANTYGASRTRRSFTSSRVSTDDAFAGALLRSTGRDHSETYLAKDD